MKANRMIATVIATTMISAFANSVLQTTNGYHNVFKKTRERMVNKFSVHKTPVAEMPSGENISMLPYDETDGTLAELTTCPWCFSPWVTLPVYLGVTAILKPEATKREHLLGYAVSTAAAAFQRVNGMIF